uniref:Vitellogenin domain-containing protein n=1 Tax=Ditylenchus dipsaci TaxID=166011 RepID=A0A915DX26_9BILA
MRLKLDLPVEFAYVNGNVERLQFHSDDKPWSKNLKKAVLNLIQLQMTPANGQEIEDEEENGQNKYAKAFTTTETTLEGICPVSYSIMASPKNTTEINITKSINFQRCQKLADVGYGFQVEPTVESAWSELKDSNRPFLTSEQNHLLDCEWSLLSEYIAKSSQAESSQAMQTIAASELVFVEWNAAGNQETGLLTSVLKTKNSEQEIEKAENHLQELVVAFGEKNQQKGGIESSTTIEHFEKLVHIMRLCSLEELKNLDKKANKIDSSNKQKVAADLFADALAVAATRNTIVLLEKKIKEQSGISEVKAVQVLKVLGRGAGLPAPSDCQVDAILRLCKSDVVSDSKVLKQSCWLTFGAMVGELSLQNNKAKLMKQTTSPMRADETTADHKMQLYKDVLIKPLKEAESIPEKIFALKCIGNAALGFAVPELREVIERRSECPAVRIYAIDALRRLRHQLKPQKIHSIVMPIYMNTDEKPELRMNAFSMVMQTRPSNAIVDQIAFTMTSEKSDDVQSFVYSTMKSASLSPIPEQQTIANQLKNALKLLRSTKNS